MEFENLLFEQRGKFAIVTMNRPKAMNALNDATLGELNKALDEIEKNAGIKGVIITGNGKAFVAGADISQMVDYNPYQQRQYNKYAQGTFNRIDMMEKPFIAAVNGYALGGGCELSMACDIRIASDKAVFGQPEIKLGVIPSFGGSQRLPRLVGTGMAKELLYTGRNVDAAEAKAIGLVNKVVPADTLLDEAIKMMEDIVSKSGIAVGFAKQVIGKGMDTDIYKAMELEADIMAVLFATEDQKEGMRAFLEKRPANFTS
jgi:enoyl-CoA hydratase